MIFVKVERLITTRLEGYLHSQGEEHWNVTMSDRMVEVVSWSPEVHETLDPNITAFQRE